MYMWQSCMRWHAITHPVRQVACIFAFALTRERDKPWELAFDGAARSADIAALTKPLQLCCLFSRAFYQTMRYMNASVWCAPACKDEAYDETSTLALSHSRSQGAHILQKPFQSESATHNECHSIIIIMLT